MVIMNKTIVQGDISVSMRYNVTDSKWEVALNEQVEFFDRSTEATARFNELTKLHIRAVEIKK